MRHRVWIVLALTVAGCVTLTPEQTLSHELFVDASRQCESRYHTIHVDLVHIDGSLDISAEAESRSEYQPFVACYREALKAYADARRKAGLPVPETLMEEHDVDLD
ncbi:MAG: hypothetical protein ACHQU1_04800 [Gemmatimonadales bacterium]